MSADENSDSSPQRGEVGRGEYWPLHPALLRPPQPAGGGSRMLDVSSSRDFEQALRQLRCFKAGEH